MIFPRDRVIIFQMFLPFGGLSRIMGGFLMVFHVMI